MMTTAGKRFALNRRPAAGPSWLHGSILSRPLMGLVCWALVAGPLPCRAEDWPQFRGPDGQGHSSESGLPGVWAEDRNIAWKTPIPGLGWSSPVVRGDRVWLTTAIEESGTLLAIALDAQSGAIVRQVEVFHQRDLGRISQKNSHASPTPVLEADRVYVHFGAHGTACLDAEGKVLWKTVLQHDHRHGPAGSPVLWNDLLFIACDGADHQYLVALDKATGAVRWKQNRPGEAAYSTPLVIRSGRGATHFGRRRRGGGLQAEIRRRDLALPLRRAFQRAATRLWRWPALRLHRSLDAQSVRAARRRSRRRDQYPRGGACTVRFRSRRRRCWWATTCI